MRRRDFIKLVGGAAAWPVAAHSQSAGVPVIGYLHSGSPEGNHLELASFRLGLKESGFSEPENVKIQFRWAQDNLGRLPALAADLVRERANVIFTLGGVAPTLAARSASTTIPIVFTHGSDPVKTGLVASLNRPGGNITGLSLFTGAITAKRLELLREIVPKASVVAVLVNSRSATGEARLSEAEEASRVLGLKLQVLDIASASDFDAAFASLDRQRPDAVFEIADPMFRAHREKVLALATQRGLPMMHSARENVAAGGLISYGVDVPEIVRQAGVYVARILKGEKAADLPVLLPTKFELVINRKTAQALGLEIPPKLLFTADEVIE